MRTKYSIYNSISSIVSSFTTMILGFLAQSVFVRILGFEYLGLNGLFTNILTMLSFFELGIGNAIVYHLYKPIANGDKKTVKALMNFYKRAYNIIAVIVFVIGMILLPFVNIFVGKVTVDINVHFLFFLFLLSTVSTYLVAYKRSILYADQKNYIVNIIHTIYTIVLNITQLLMLYFTKNFYLYLIVKIVCQLLENIIITVFANKYYPLLKEKNNEKIDKDIEKDIFSKVKALLCHKVGSVVTNGTDNIIISKILGVVMVGIYSNYELLVRACTLMFGQIISSTTASVGNLLASKDRGKAFTIFKKIRFINFWISCFTATSLLVISQPFIKIWIGNNGLLPLSVVMVIVFNYFQKMQRHTYFAFKDSAGIWEEDKYVPIIEAVINLIISITLAKFIGLSGIILGTIISGFCYWFYSYPKFVYTKLFNRTYLDFFKETIGYILLFVVIALSTLFVSNLISLNSTLLQVIVNSCLCLLIPNICICVLFNKTNEYKYVKELFGKIFKKVFKKKKIA